MSSEDYPHFPPEIWHLVFAWLRSPGAPRKVDIKSLKQCSLVRREWRRVFLLFLFENHTLCLDPSKKFVNYMLDGRIDALRSKSGALAKFITTLRLYRFSFTSRNEPGFVPCLTFVPTFLPNLTTLTVQNFRFEQIYQLRDFAMAIGPGLKHMHLHNVGFSNWYEEHKNCWHSQEPYWDQHEYPYPSLETLEITSRKPNNGAITPILKWLSCTPSVSTLRKVKLDLVGGRENIPCMRYLLNAPLASIPTVTLGFYIGSSNHLRSMSANAIAAGDGEASITCDGIKALRLVSKGVLENELIHAIICDSQMANLEILNVTYVLNSDHLLGASTINERTGRTLKKRFPALKRFNAKFVGYVPRDYGESDRPIVNSCKFATACMKNQVFLGVYFVEKDRR